MLRGEARGGTGWYYASTQKVRWSELMGACAGQWFSASVSQCVC